jgi:hypothetical protein
MTVRNDRLKRLNDLGANTVAQNTQESGRATTDPELELHLALFEDDDRTDLLADERRWIVRSLDHEMFAYGMTQRDALVHFFVSLNAELEDARENQRAPLEGVPKASAKFLEWWKAKAKHQVEVPREVVAKAPPLSRLKVMEREARAL